MLILPTSNDISFLFNKGNWARKEISIALSINEIKDDSIKIIPIAFNKDFAWPDKNELEEISPIVDYNIFYYDMNAKEFYKAYSKVTSSSESWEERADKEKNNVGEKRIYGMRSLRRKEGQDKANCQHCYTKQRLLNPENRNRPLELPEWTDNESILDHEGATENHWLVCLYNVAICEHLRWNVKMELLGFESATKENIKKAEEKSKDKQRNTWKSFKLRRHECIVDCQTLHSNPVLVKTIPYDEARVKLSFEMRDEIGLY